VAGRNLCADICGDGYGF